MTAILGDFLGPASDHIAQAVAYADDLPAAEAGHVVAELGRVIAALGRFLGDIALPDKVMQYAPKAASPLATVGTWQALRQSALTLHQASEGQGRASEPDAHPVVLHLAAAASHLAAGHDVLPNRCVPELTGPRTSAAALAGRFYWPAVAASPPVTAALLAEITGHARTLAALTVQLSQRVPGGPARTALHDATRWLCAAAETWQQHRALPLEARVTLHRIPVFLSPARHPPAGPETIAQLCTGIADTTARLRHAAVEFAPCSFSSPAANSVSWRQHARAAAVTTHASHLILRAAAIRAARLSPGGALRGQLSDAIELAAGAWPRHRMVSHLWDRLVTGHGINAELTPVAVEFDDLVLRVGRLAYHDPFWAPGVAHAAPARKPDRLAPAMRDIHVLAATVHHAADAIMISTVADRQAIGEAAQAGRIYMASPAPAGNSGQQSRYTRPSARGIRDLLTAYDNAIRSAGRLTSALDDLAISAALPSAVLAEPRQSPAPRHFRQPLKHVTDLTTVSIPEAGQVRKLLHELRITEPTMLARAELADAATLSIIDDAMGQASRRGNLGDPDSRRGPSGGRRRTR